MFTCCSVASTPKLAPCCHQLLLAIDANSNNLDVSTLLTCNWNVRQIPTSSTERKDPDLAPIAPHGGHPLRLRVEHGVQISLLHA